MKYKHYNRKLRHMLSAPFIWLVFVPILLLDIIIELYHRTCFPLYGLKYIERKRYIKLDRYKLPYLKWYDRINCLYCEYVNGFLLYAAAIAGKTEEYWCGIKHDTNYKLFVEPVHHKDFLKYDDKKSFEKHCKLKKL